MLQHNHLISTRDGATSLCQAVFFEPTKLDKAKRIAKIGCDFYIDDLPEILELLPPQITKILYSPDPFSTVHKSFTHMRSWDELQTIIA